MHTPLLQRDERHRFERVVFVARRAASHPSWAVANLVNVVDRARDRRRATWEYDATSPAVAVANVGDWSLPEVEAALAATPRIEVPATSGMYGAPDGSTVYQQLLYAITRLLRPSYVVETGVARGCSSAAVLHALDENADGDLVSIDLPHLHPAAASEVGCAVPEELRRRWDLRFGPGSRSLRSIARAGRPADVFAQDGPHSTRGQLREYRAGWMALRPGGILISDDVGPAFDVFAAEVGRTPTYVSQLPKLEPIGLLRR